MKRGEDVDARAEPLRLRLQSTMTGCHFASWLAGQARIAYPILRAEFSAEELPGVDRFLEEAGERGEMARLVALHAGAGAMPVAPARAPMAPRRAPMARGRVPIAAGRDPVPPARAPMPPELVPIAPGRDPVPRARGPLAAERDPDLRPWNPRGTICTLRLFSAT